jgi:hypothetical protein
MPSPREILIGATSFKNPHPCKIYCACSMPELTTKTMFIAGDRRFKRLSQFRGGAVEDCTFTSLCRNCECSQLIKMLLAF